MITFCVSTYNNLEYLKWCIKSVKENAYFNTAPFIVHAENCTDGTNEWLKAVKDMYKLEVYIELEVKPARGIGGGMNFCADKAKTEYIIFLQSDFYVARDFDLILLEEIKKYNDKHVISSWRVQPNIFNNQNYLFVMEPVNQKYFENEIDELIELILPTEESEINRR